MIKTVIFDLDGTILDTLDDLTMATNYSTGKFGYPPITRDDTRRNIGNGIRNLILRSVGYDETHVDEMFQDFKEYYTPNCNNFTKPYPGILSLLYKLKEEGYSLACISNKAEYALSILCDAHFKGLFSSVIGDGEGFKKKPDPETIVETAKRLSVSLDEIVYVGDSDVDVATVKNSGIHGIFVDWGYRSVEKLKECGADPIVDTPEEVYEKIQVMNHDRC